MPLIIQVTFFLTSVSAIFNRYRDDDPGTKSILSLRVTGTRSFVNCSGLLQGSV